MNKLFLILIIATFSFGCAGIRSAIPTISVDTSAEAFDINVNSRIDRGLLCVPEQVSGIPILGDIISTLVGTCGDVGAEEAPVTL